MMHKHYHHLGISSYIKVNGGKVSFPPFLSRSTSTFRNNDHIHGFSVQSTVQVPELQLDVTQLSHVKTGAKHIHFARQDSNNVFAVGFRTPVDDSTGVPHILEHTTLCGSKKYPIRDPFFKMLQRSLSTFMNAMTYQDLTLYPFATQNLIDYQNLMSVYMNAVFEPNLKRLDFAQEGWRLQHTVPNDKQSKLEFKGVVYNEMKGAMSGIHYQFAMALNTHLFRNSVYAPNSGGDPREITNLTYDQLVHFHRQFYTPANAHFLTYGDFPLHHTLDFVNRALNQLPTNMRLQTNPHVNDLPNCVIPKIVHESCMADPMGDIDQQARFCIAWGCNDVIADAYTTTALSVLSKLLLDGSSSPMQQALIDSSLAPDYSPVIGYDSSSRRASFAIGVQGVRLEQLSKIEETIWQVLNKVAVDGFSTERIDAIIHQMELGMRHVTASFGIHFVQNIAPSIIQGSNLTDLMSVTKHLRRLEVDAKKNQLFQNLIRQYLLDNPYRVTMTMAPDLEFAAKADLEESNRLDTLTHSLSDAERHQVYHDGLELIKAQESVQDVSILPCLSIADISRDAMFHPIEQVSPATKSDLSPSVFIRKAPTNGISYISSLADIRHLDKDLVDYLPLFSSALTWQGTHKKEMDILDQELRLYTGGVGMSAKIRTSLDGNAPETLEYSIGGNALTSNVPQLTRLMSELSFETRFDRIDRLKNLIAGNISSMMNGLADRGHSLAMSLAASMILPSYTISEHWNGLTQLKFLSGLQTKEEEVATKLEQICGTLRSSRVKHLVVSQEAGISKVVDHLPTISSRFNFDPSANVNQSELDQTVDHQNATKVYVPMPSFSVNYCAKAIRGVPYLDHKQSVALTLAAKIMTYKFLHREIREKGGAYGGGANYSAVEGVFLMYSYRDPRMLDTICDFDRALKWFEVGAVVDQDLVEAKLSVFGALDRPIDVGAQGSLEFGLGIDHQVMQLRRDILFNITVSDVCSAVQNVLVKKNSALSDRCDVIIGAGGENKNLVGLGWNVYDYSNTM